MEVDGIGHSGFSCHQQIPLIAIRVLIESSAGMKLITCTEFLVRQVGLDRVVWSELVSPNLIDVAQHFVDLRFARPMMSTYS